MEREEFTLAVHQYQNMVFRIALHYFADPDDADDIVQEVFLRFLQQEHTFDSNEHTKYWLLRVTINLCKDTLKSPWRRRRVRWDAVPEEPVWERQEQQALFQEVMALPEKYRTVLNLYYYEELSTKEIATLLQVQQSVVTTRLSRARQLLKERLGEVWSNE